MSEVRVAKKPSWSLLLPVVYAAALPILRIGLRDRVPPKQLNKILGGTVAIALGHAGYILFTDSTV